MNIDYIIISCEVDIFIVTILRIMSKIKYREKIRFKVFLMADVIWTLINTIFTKPYIEDSSSHPYLIIKIIECINNFIEGKL